MELLCKNTRKYYYTKTAAGNEEDYLIKRIGNRDQGGSSISKL